MNAADHAITWSMFDVAIVDDEEELLYSLKIILEAEGCEISTYPDPVHGF